MIKEMERLVREAGALVRSAELSGRVHVKGQSDFVTDADLAVSRFLTEKLPELVPGSRVISEEGPAGAARSGRVFIIDPVDGTTNLMYRMGLSAVSCGYVEDGEPVAGVIYNPFTDELFSAEKGKGAYLNGEPIAVNEDAVCADAIIGLEAGPATLSEQRPFLDRVGDLYSGCRGIRLTGSAAVDLAYIAAGRFSATVFHYLYPWDFCAGWVILNEAGGKLTLLDGGEPLLEGRSRPLLASNGRLHEALIDFFK